MRLKRILAVLLASAMVISEVQPVYATENTEYTDMEQQLEEYEPGAEDEILEDQEDAEEEPPEEGVSDEQTEETDEEEDITEDSEVEAQTAVQTESTDKTSEDESDVKTIYRNLPVISFENTEPDEYELALLSDEDTEWSGSYGDQLTDSVSAELYDALKTAFIDDGYEADEPSAPLSVEVTLKNPITYQVDSEGKGASAAVARISKSISEAWSAFYHDYPEIYWVFATGGQYALNETLTTGSISWVELTVDTQYYEKCNETLEDFQAAVQNIVEEAQEEEGDDRYGLVKYFHDYLCGELSYNTEASSADEETLTDYLYAYTAATSILGYGDKGKSVVCEGYAKAFKILCDEADIPCVLVPGLGGTGDKKGSHMWNYVQMEDENWYLVDATWDDQGEDLYDTYFLAGSNSEGFNGETAGEQHIPQTIIRGGTEGCQTFVFPELSESAYEPSEENTTIDLKKVYEDGTLKIDYATRYTWTGEAIDMAPYSVQLGDEELLKGRDYRITYEDANGKATEYAKNVGKYTMIIEGIGDYRGSLRFAVQITKDYALSAMTISSIAAQTFTGNALRPTIKITNPKTKAVLKEGTHYKLQYSNNVNAGTATITIQAIEGKGYTGRITKTFTINPCSVSSLSVAGMSSSYEYTGEEIQPELTLKFGDLLLAEETDYTLIYKNTVDAGTASIQIHGLGNYSGDRTLTYQITSAQLAEENVTLNTDVLSKGENPAVEVTWNGSVLTKGTDYTLTFSRSTDQKTGTVTVRGKGNYGGIVKKSYEIPPIEIQKDQIAFAGTWYYTGSPIAVAPEKIVINGRTLNKGVDYVLSYEDEAGNTLSKIRAAGSYVLVVKGLNLYTGTVRLPFKVSTDKLLGRMKVTQIPGQTYTGAEIRPTIEVTDPGNIPVLNLFGIGADVLQEGTHYEMEYLDNVNVGTAKIHLTAIEDSGYAGERTIYFQITPYDISDESDESVQVTLPHDGKMNFDGTASEPEPTITINGKTLKKDVDYTVAWYDNQKLGTAYMIIKGIGNYTGTRKVTYEIVENTLEPEVECTLEAGNYQYTGAEICPKVTLTDKKSGATLTEGTHYRVFYENNINAGNNAAIVIYGIEAGGYSGMYTQKFTITQRNVESEDITVSFANSEAESVRPLDVLITDGDYELVEDQDYEIEYEEKADSTVALIKGIGNYTGSRTETITRTSLNDKNVKYTLAYYETLYTGSRLTPKTTVKIDGTVLEEGRDYTVSYDRNLDIGSDATATIQGRGLYTGTLSKTFTIQPVDINRASVGNLSSCTFWQVKNASVNLTYRGKRLQADRDYTVSFANEIKVGSNTVIVEGTGNYKGTIELKLQVTFPSSARIKLTACKITPEEEMEGDTTYTGPVTVQLTAADGGKFASLISDQKIYVQVPGPNGNTVWSEGTVDAATKTITATFPADKMLRSNIMSRYTLAVATTSGHQQIATNSLYVSNPDKYARTVRTYFGFYEGKTDSKKGMQGTMIPDTKNLGVQAALININLNELIKTKQNVKRYGSACYTAYKYKGKTYYFHNMVKYRKTILELNGNGFDTYGDWTKNVTVDLLMKWDPELTYLIYPSGRVAGKNDYALNMSEAKARETLEALFCYVTEALGGTRGTNEGGWFDGDGSRGPERFRVCNWVLGNEVNACKAWNYAGNISTQACADNYAKAFQILYQAVKKSDRNARVFISLDHTWTAWTGDGHPGKDFLNRFAYYMHATEPQMQWNVNYHPYSNPLYRNDFWNDGSSTSGSESTAYISMRNLSVLTNYLSKLERTYGLKSNSVRVILGEQGYIAANKGQEASQAAAIAYEFYIASANKRVDAMINRAYVDDKAEGIMTLGIRYNNKKGGEKAAYTVFKYMDSVNALTDSRVTKYAGYVRSGAKNWTQVISGLKTETFRK